MVGWAKPGGDRVSVGIHVVMMRRKLGDLGEGMGGGTLGHLLSTPDLGDLLAQEHVTLLADIDDLLTSDT